MNKWKEVFEFMIIEEGLKETMLNYILKEIKELQEIISYCEAKAKEHKIDLEDGE